MENTQDTRQQSVEHFLEMIRASRRGKFKIYIGMAAGVGKTYRMLQEAHQLLRNGADVCIGIIETHGRTDITTLIEGLPQIPKKSLYYKGKSLNEMDLQSVLIRKPEILLVDELAHTNIPGSINVKRWEDVIEILEAGISVISTLNIQHIESINKEVEKITGINVKERIPDTIIEMADEVVNVDLTISDLIRRLEEGKIYDLEKVPVARRNFFQEEKLLQLRELALREVTRQVGRQINRVTVPAKKNNAILTCLSSSYFPGLNLIRQSSRFVSLYNSKWYVLYVQTPDESFEKIDGSDQRNLLNNLKLAAELDAEVVKVKSGKISETIAEFALMKEVGLIIMGNPAGSFLDRLRKENIMKKLIALTQNHNIDILIISSHE